MFIHVYLSAENICVLQLFRNYLYFVPNFDSSFKIALGKRHSHIFLYRQVHMKVYRDDCTSFFLWLEL